MSSVRDVCNQLRSYLAVARDILHLVDDRAPRVDLRRAAWRAGGRHSVETARLAPSDEQLDLQLSHNIAHPQ